MLSPRRAALMLRCGPCEKGRCENCVDGLRVAAGLPGRCTCDRKNHK